MEAKHSIKIDISQYSRRICIPVKEKSLKKTQEQVKKALWLIKHMAKSVEFKYRKLNFMLEIWLDSDVWSKGRNFGDLLKQIPLPVIAVCKSGRDGGFFNGTEMERMNILTNALEAGAAYIDVDFNMPAHFIKKLKKECAYTGAQMIISVHFWREMPSLNYLLKLAAGAARLADIIKIAVFVKEWPYNAVLFELTKRMAAKGKKIIVIGMGEKGRISRFGCPLLGSYLAYAALSDKAATAPGQFRL